MELRRLQRVWTALALVGLVAIAFVVPFEYRNRRRGAVLFDSEVRYLNQAGWHLEQVARCNEMIANGRPYLPEDRQRFNLRKTLPLWLAPDPSRMTDWEAEATYHFERGRRLIGHAEANAAEILDIRRKLLFP